MSVLACILCIAVLALLLRIMTLPVRLIYKLILNTVCGYICLILINLFAFFTGALFSLNIVTAVVVGFLGLPGIGLLFLLRFLTLL